MEDLELLRYCWRYRLYERLTTTKGEQLKYTDGGLFNRNGEPAFFNAKVWFNHTLWVGNVEVLEKASDWYLNARDKDWHYDNVILVIVGLHDTDIMNSQGHYLNIAQVEIPPTLREHYKKLMEDETHAECWAYNGETLPHLSLHAWLSSLATEFLEQESERTKQIALDTGSWDMALFVMLARYYGYRKHPQLADTMEKWAKSLPQNVLMRHRDDLFQLEALMLGQAGLLTVEAILRKFEQEALMEGYFAKLRNEYQYLAHKYSLEPSNCEEWYHPNGRDSLLPPLYYPHEDIARMANMCYMIRLERTFINNVKSARIAKAWCNVGVAPYWETHRSFGEVNPKRSEKRPSVAKQEEIVMRVVVPYIFAYGRFEKKEPLCDLAFDLMDQVKPEQNCIIKRFASHGIEVRDACEAIALSQVKQEYCDKKQCLRCRFGNNFLKQK